MATKIDRIQIGFRELYDESDLEFCSAIVMRCGGKVILSYMESDDIGTVIADVKDKETFLKLLKAHPNAEDIFIIN